MSNDKLHKEHAKIADQITADIKTLVIKYNIKLWGWDSGEIMARFLDESAEEFVVWPEEDELEEYDA